MRAYFIYDPSQDAKRVKVVQDDWAAKGHDTVELPQLADAQVAIVLIDTNTSENPDVRNAVKAAHERRVPLLGVHVHNLLGVSGERSPIGNNRFGELAPSVFFWQHYPTHRWVIEDGAAHIEDWVEEAMQSTHQHGA